MLLSCIIIYRCILHGAHDVTTYGIESSSYNWFACFKYSTCHIAHCYVSIFWFACFIYSTCHIANCYVSILFPLLTWSCILQCAPLNVLFLLVLWSAYPQSDSHSKRHLANSIVSCDLFPTLYHIALATWPNCAQYPVSWNLISSTALEKLQY